MRHITFISTHKIIKANKAAIPDYTNSACKSKNQFVASMDANPHTKNQPYDSTNHWDFFFFF